MRQRTTIEVIAVIAIVVAVSAIVASSVYLPPRVEKNLQAAIGKTLAREALSLLKPGGRVTVIGRDTEAFPHPGTDLLLEGFQKELNQSGAAASTMQRIQLDPLKPMEVPSGDFFETLRRASPGDVIVSLLGPPILSEEQRRQIGSVKPKIVAFYTGNLEETMDLNQLFAAGLLHVAVVNRRAQGPQAATVSTSGDLFEQRYTILRSSAPSALLTRSWTAL